MSEWPTSEAISELVSMLLSNSANLPHSSEHKLNTLGWRLSWVQVQASPSFFRLGVRRVCQFRQPGSVFERIIVFSERQVSRGVCLMTEREAYQVLDWP